MIEDIVRIGIIGIEIPIQGGIVETIGVMMITIEIGLDVMIMMTGTEIVKKSFSSLLT